MRLGFEAWGLSRNQFYTGMGQYAANLLQQLPRRAPEISVVAYAGRDERRPAWLAETVEWRPIKYRVPRKLEALFSRVFLLPALARRDRLDLFHAPAVHIRPSVPPVPRLACPTVVTLHDLIPSTFYGLSDLPRTWRTFYTWNLRRASKADALITVSRHARDEIVRGMPVQAERISVVPNAVFFKPNDDKEPLRRLGICPPYILYAGSYEPRKNLRGALSAYNLLVQRGLPHRFIAVVEASSGHSLGVAALLQTLNLGDRVRLVHSLADSDLRALYTSAAILFFPSLAEGFGFPPVQAALCGVPAVVSDIGVLREVLDDSVMYVDPRNQCEMADGLRRVLEDHPLRARLIAAGGDRASLYQGQSWAQRHVEIYEQVLVHARST
jgi:glycosyltransferase involved in cell wall biosynthesis